VKLHRERRRRSSGILRINISGVTYKALHTSVHESVPAQRRHFRPLIAILNSFLFPANGINARLSNSPWTLVHSLCHVSDAIGIVPMDPLHVFEGYTINEPWVIVLALAHNYEQLKQVPSDEINGEGVTSRHERLDGSKRPVSLATLQIQ
jgi:hypothetical protein